MVPSFFVFSPYAILYHIGHGKRYGTPARSNALPHLTVHPCLISTYTRRLPHEGGTFPTASKLFFRKMENFFSIRKCINWKKRKVHLAICKAKLFFTVNFQICVVNTHYFSGILTNYPGAIQNKLSVTDKEYSVQLSGNTASSLHEDFVRSRF